MKLSSRIVPLSYFRANATEVLRDLATHADPLIITHKGAARAVLQDIDTYGRTQETLALLTLLAVSQHEIAAGETKGASAVFAELSHR